MTGVARRLLQAGLLSLFIAGTARAQNTDRPAKTKPAPSRQTPQSAKNPSSPNDKKRREKLESDALKMRELLEASPQNTGKPKDALYAPEPPLPEPTH